MTVHANNELDKVLTLALGEGGMRKAIEKLTPERRAEVANWAGGHQEQCVVNAGAFARILASADLKEVDSRDLGMAWWIVSGLISEAEVAGTIAAYARSAPQTS